MDTVHDRFVATSARSPGSEFLFADAVTAEAYGIPAVSVTWGAAADEVERLRAAYAAAGYGHGHRVGLLLENRPAFLLHWFALNALGASVVPINAEMRAAELEYLVGHSEIALAVSLPERCADLRAAARATGVRMAVWEGASGAPPAAPHVAPLGGLAPGHATECALLYTSG